MYDDALALEGDIAANYETRDLFAHELRATREELADREAVVSIETRAEHSQASAAEFARIVKIAIQQDEQCRSLRARIASAQRDHDRAESLASLAERRLKTVQARMIELGGLAVFYGLRSGRSNTHSTAHQEKQT